MRILFHVIILVSKLIDDVLNVNNAVFRRERGEESFGILRGPSLARQQTGSQGCAGYAKELESWYFFHRKKPQHHFCGDLQYALKLEHHGESRH